MVNNLNELIDLNIWVSVYIYFLILTLLFMILDDCFHGAADL